MIQPNPGEINQRHLADASHGLVLASSAFNKANRVVVRLRSLTRRLRFGSFALRSLLNVRFVMDRCLPRWGWFALIPVLSWAVLTVAAIALEFGHWQAASAGILGIVLGIVVSYGLLCRPSDHALAKWAAELQLRLFAALEDLRSASAVAAPRLAAFEQAKDTYQRISEILASRMHRLLTCSWETMEGITFENFLAEVFRERGFTVELTRATADHGVDLVVSRGGLRIAIQAKGYPSGNSVGNDAVLRVVGGMRIYGCNTSGVITNSCFTAHAVSAAQMCGCTLIDGTQIAKLIRGETPW